MPWAQHLIDGPLRDTPLWGVASTIGEHMKSAAVVVGLTAAVFALPAAAQMMSDTSAFYAGAGFGQSKAKEWCSTAGGISCDDRDTAWRAFGGYQLNRNFAAELGYTKLGGGDVALGPTPGDKSDIDVFGLSALWRFR